MYEKIRYTNCVEILSNKIKLPLVNMLIVSEYIMICGKS